MGVLGLRPAVNSYSRAAPAGIAAAGTLALTGAAAASSSSAPTLVRQNTAPSETGSTSRTIFLSGVGAGHSLVLTIANFDTAPVSSVADTAGNSWTKVVETNSSAGGVGTVSMWLCKNPAASSGGITITATLGSTNVTSALNVSEWSKPLTMRNVSTANSGTGNVASQSATVTSASNDLVLAAQSRYDNQQRTAVSPAISLSFVSASAVSNQSAYIVASGTSTLIDYTPSSGSITASVIASFSN